MKAVPTVQIDNERVIVTEWRFAPGADTGHHVHGHDYVVVPMTTGTLRLEEPEGPRDVQLTAGTLRLEEPEGPRDVQLTAGVSYARLTGVAHNVINVNPFEFSFIEIELK